MSELKAIYFNSTFSTNNPPNNTQCITFDSKEGFKFWNDGKTITVTSNTDSEQSAAIDELLKKVKLLETKVLVLSSGNNGVLETENTITVVNLAANSVGNVNKDIIIYGETPVTVAKTIIGKNVSIDGFEIKASNSKPSLTISSAETTDIKDVKVTGTFATSTNAIDVTKSNKIILKDTTLQSSGYNGVMLTQYVVKNGEPAPEEIIVDNVNFTGDLSLATLNICATANNANVEIKNCNFGKTKYAIRFRNCSNATGVNVLIENCHFDECIFDKGNLLILFEENESVSYIGPNDDAKVDAIWGAAKDFATASGVVIEEDSNGKITAKGIKDVFPYLLEFEDRENRFGKDKMTITFRNCTFGSDNTPLKFETDKYKDIIGTNAEGELIGIFRQSGRATFNPWNENFPTESSTLSFPYDDETKSYMELFKEITWTQNNKNSDCYPTIIFE